MAVSWEAVKDPDEVKDYSFNWAALLATDEDTIATSVWEVVEGSGLTIDSDDSSDTTTSVWLSAGTVNTTYLIRNRITTAGGRTYDRTGKLKVKTL